MDRKIIVGYYYKNNQLEDLVFDTTELIHQVSIKDEEDCGGFPDSKTLELLYCDKYNDYMLVLIRKREVEAMATTNFMGIDHDTVVLSLDSATNLAKLATEQSYRMPKGMTREQRRQWAKGKVDYNDPKYADLIPSTTSPHFNKQDFEEDIIADDGVIFNLFMGDDE